MLAIDTRNLRRDSLYLMAEVAAGSSECAAPVKIRNLSAGGMMAEGELRVSEGEQVAVELRNIGSVDGKVVWIDGRRFGVAFTGTIDPLQARRRLEGGPREAPSYARAALAAPRHDGWNGRLRLI